MKARAILLELDPDFWEVCNSNISTPGQKLVAAILERAVLDLFNSNKDDGRYKREAVAWFLSPKKNWIDCFSFTQVCCYLDLNKSTVHKLKKLAKAARNKKGEYYDLYFRNRPRGYRCLRYTA